MASEWERVLKMTEMRHSKLDMLNNGFHGPNKK